MKKLFSVLAVSVLLFQSIGSSLVYAQTTEPIDESVSVTTVEIVDAGSDFVESNSDETILDVVAVDNSINDEVSADIINDEAIEDVTEETEVVTDEVVTETSVETNEVSNLTTTESVVESVGDETPVEHTSTVKEQSWTEKSTN